MTTLEYLVRESQKTPMHTLVWLHGLGADGHDFGDLLDWLDLPPGVGLRLVLPHAPIRSVTMSGGTPMRAWYNFIYRDSDQRENMIDVVVSQRLICELMLAEAARLPAGGKLFLGGFSQGAVMALLTGLSMDVSLAGLVALSGYYLPPSAIKQQPPIFQAHGELDPVIPFQFGEQSRQRLEGVGSPVAWHAYPIAHSVNNEEMMDLSNWLKARVMS